jgi:hypothetical protein
MRLDHVLVADQSTTATRPRSSAPRPIFTWMSNKNPDPRARLRESRTF